MKTIAVINQKGGVGKSTTAGALGEGLKKRGYSVLFVDLDAQGNLSFMLGAQTQGYSSMGVLLNPETIEASVQSLERGDIVASSETLTGADAVLTHTGKEYRLKEALERLQDMYDFCIIDTPPALGVLTINALAAADGAVVPAQADMFSIQGIMQLNTTIATVRKYCNRELRLLGIVLTRYNGRAIISRNVAELMDKSAGEIGTHLYRTKIRECTAIKEAQALRRCIYDYAPKSNAAIDYYSLTEEILVDVNKPTTEKGKKHE